MNQIQWCTCEGHSTGDFVRTTNFYCSYFQPSGWALDDSAYLREREMALYLTGRCSICSGFTRAGMALPMKESYGDMFAQIWTALDTYRPFAFQEAGNPAYMGCPSARNRWYQQQDRLSEAEKQARFVELFSPENKVAAAQWLEQRRAIPHTQVVRDSASDLFRSVVLRAKEYGDWQEVADILDYHLPSEHEWSDRGRENTIISAYEFNFYAVAQFGGSEGIYIDCFLRGIFDDSGRRQLSVGTIKTLETNMDACKRMGALCGALMYHASAYINENLHRYTPDKELRVEAERLEAKRTAEE